MLDGQPAAKCEYLLTAARDWLQATDCDAVHGCSAAICYCRVADTGDERLRASGGRIRGRRSPRKRDMHTQGLEQVRRYLFRTMLMAAAIPGLAGTNALADGWYTVQAGDSLWRIAEQHLDDPSRWPELWQNNPGIANPHRLNPGERVHIEPGEHRTGPEPLALLTEQPPKPTPTGQPVPVEPPSGKLTWTSLDSTLNPTPKPSSPAPYVDKLIDPSTPTDEFIDYAPQFTGRAGQLEQSVELVGRFRDDGVYYHDATEYGIRYTASTRAPNWGDLQLTVVALDETDTPASTGNPFFESQQGIARVTLEQRNLPITESTSADIIAGTHRQTNYNPFRKRPNLINFRFGSAEPDIEGLSSHLRFGQSSVSLSGGRLGQSRGTVLPGFVETEGDVRRIQMTHTLARHAFSGDVWRTEGQTLTDNRTGFRLGYDWLLGEHTMFSFSGVGSGANYAALLGGSTRTDASKHDYGAYYFDPDILWLDARIGDDNAGLFYRFHTRRGGLTWGASIEHRRDGLSAPQTQQRDTSFLSLNFVNRFSRRASLSTVYNYRRIALDATDNAANRALHEHSLRGYYTLTHTNAGRSRLGTRLRVRDDAEELDVSYGWSRDLDNNSTIELEAAYRSQFADDGDTNRLSAFTRFSRRMFESSFLSLGLGYEFAATDFNDNRGLTGYVNFETALTDQLLLTLQLDYSRQQTEDLQRDISATLFTGGDLEVDDFSSHREFSALLKLQWRTGQASSPSILAARGRNGAGSVRGVVYLDHNNDGVRQAGEPGVAGITVFLNSVYPVVTDARGEYHFPHVGLGQHFLFIDESTLPLPWALNGREYTPFNIHLRQATEMDIAMDVLVPADQNADIP